ncbi:MAG: chromosome segregation protein SMC, partial [Actinobacteria bacterium]
PQGGGAGGKGGPGVEGRREALAFGLRRKGGAGALLARPGEVPGLLGSLATMLTVQPGHEVALAAALGTLADAVAVSGVDEAVEAIRFLKIQDAGQATLVVGSPAGPGMIGSADALRPALPEGAIWAPDVIECHDEIRPAVNRALRDVVLVEDLSAAARVVAANPELRAVTRDGDVLGAYAATGGSAKATSYLEVQAAVEEARAQRAAAEAAVAELSEQLAAARAEADARKEAVAEAAAAKRAAEGERNAAARRLAELGAAVRSARAEAERLATARARAEQAREQDLATLAELEERLRIAEATPIDEEPSTEERDMLAAMMPQARQNEMEVRLAVRTAEERVAAIAGRADALLRQAAAERAARERAAARRAARARGAAIARAVELGARAAQSRLAESIAIAAKTRDELTQARAVQEAELQELRAAAERLRADLERITGEMHRDEVARAERRLRIEQLETKAAEEFGIDVETLIAEYGPHQPVPPTPAEVAAAEAEGRPAPEPVPFDRATLEKRAGKAERELALLGKVNPLALEEFAALEERYKFLSDQLEDLKATRRDLLTVVKDVDERILEIFASAFEDTAREFEQVFEVLFPGGEGRLVLTDPNDLLTTGVEVEARPPGKKIKRLSLLSGGERSLTAVAMLVAIFRARPSPFYVMDEVEAALDDVNLGRLLTLLTQLREKSQLIIITHQKRTMEIADALYGVTMRNGVSQVISQRLKRDGEE